MTIDYERSDESVEAMLRPLFFRISLKKLDSKFKTAPKI